MSETRRFFRLRSLSILGGFLDGLELEFAEGLNCLIGHRGTGKTTVLEFIRYALDAFPPGEAGAASRRRVCGIVRANLDDGRIRLIVETGEGACYVIERRADSAPLVRTPEGDRTDIEVHPGGTFHADILSHGGIEQLADDPEALLARIDAFAPEGIAEVQAQIADVRADLDANARVILPLEEAQGRGAAELGAVVAVDHRIRDLARAGGPGGEEIGRAQQRRSQRQRQAQALQAACRLLRQYADWLGEGRGRFADSVAALFPDELLDGPSGPILRRVRQRLEELGGRMDDHITRAASLLAAEQQRLSEDTRALAEAYEGEERAFWDLVERCDGPQEPEWECTRSGLLARQKRYAETAGLLAELWHRRAQLSDRLSALRDRRYRLRRQAAQRITQALGLPIRVDVEQAGNRECYMRLLSEALRQAAVKHRDLAQRMAERMSPRDIAAFLRDGDSEALRSCANLSEVQAARVAGALRDPALLLRLEAVELPDRPRLQMRLGDTWRDAESLSTGRKCTLVLPIVLLEGENPLLLDQPEDNLDTGFIYDIVVAGLRRAKVRRQIVLATHNSNIPVLGEAERVFVLACEDHHANLSCAGSVQECMGEILHLLEGGEEAFARRQERYRC